VRLLLLHQSGLLLLELLLLLCLAERSMSKSTRTKSEHD
jgi:hypothetical protein